MRRGNSSAPPGFQWAGARDGRSACSEAQLQSEAASAVIDASQRFDVPPHHF